MEKTKIKLYEDQEMSIYDLSKKSNTTRSTLYKYATGQKAIDNMTVGTLRKLSAIIGISQEELYIKIKDKQEQQKKEA